MCVGYCKTTLAVSEKEATLTEEKWGRGAGSNLPPQFTTLPLSPKEWQDIVASAVTANIDPLPETIGCPDCADGGAESLTIVRHGRLKRISFEAGSEVKEAQQLLERMRLLREKFTHAR